MQKIRTVYSLHRPWVYFWELQYNIIGLVNEANQLFLSALTDRKTVRTAALVTMAVPCNLP